MHPKKKTGGRVNSLTQNQSRAHNDDEEEITLEHILLKGDKAANKLRILQLLAKIFLVRFKEKKHYNVLKKQSVRNRKQLTCRWHGRK